ncbi:MAG: metallophosphoesterase family protein [Anaerolineales bacterium]
MHEIVTLGVIADTHVPDRSRSLPPAVFQIFEQAGVQAILHAGDFSSRTVFEQLSRIAPVHAVRGNRDIWVMRHLPRQRVETFGGVRIGMIHGHGSLWDYLNDKRIYYTRGIGISVFEQRALDAFAGQDVDVVVFGHIHTPINRRVNDGRLLFNPGTTSTPLYPHQPRTVGLLHLRQGQVYGEVAPLEGRW